jgi:hypothetical protein
MAYTADRLRPYRAISSFTFRPFHSARMRAFRSSRVSGASAGLWVSLDLTVAADLNGFVHVDGEGDGGDDLGAEFLGREHGLLRDVGP